MSEERSKIMDDLIAQDADLIVPITDADQAAAEDWLNANNDRLIDALDLAEAFARHRMEERAAIVAWLKKDIGPWLRDEREEYAVEFAAAIEAGEHLK